MCVNKLLIACTVFLSATVFQARSQGCTTLGQTPPTAFPVCGSDTFSQQTVPVCFNGLIPAPGCPLRQDTYEDTNPYWYKFTCFTAGTLGLTIQPNDLSDDYDWEIFDITGHDPNDVYTDPSLVVGFNWSGLLGVTGTSPDAASVTECGSFNTSNPPIFSKMPNLVLGHNYLLMISHFRGDQQSGYKLSFGGGTAGITDTLPPALTSATASCDAVHITVRLNKKMKCSSLAADGSDFGLSPSVASIRSALGNGCSSGFDMDSVTLQLDGPLTPGNYTLTAENGTDGNTLLDICNAQIPAGDSLHFAFEPTQPTPLDSITPPHCAPQVIQLVFRRNIRCSSIAADGSDFSISGPVPVAIAGAAGRCDSNGESNIILVKLANPIVNEGVYSISLAPGADGNTIIDECGHSTPVGETLTFSVKDTVSAAFSDQLSYGCRNDTILFGYTLKNGVDRWRWVFDPGGATTSLDPEEIYALLDTPRAQLIVSNGFCSDTATKTIPLGNAISAAFEAPNILCPKDPAFFKNNSTGNILYWNWDFGDRSGSPAFEPPGHLYPQTGVETKYKITLVAENGLGCKDTAVELIDVLRSCYIAVPSAFTPNGDGVNDYLYPLNAYNADGLDFRVYSRSGQLVFEARTWTEKWDGRVGGQPLPAGTFVWTLQYTDRDTGKKFFQQGISVLIR
jgi:gliding motility-associated-like protein